MGNTEHLFERFRKVPDSHIYNDLRHYEWFDEVLAQIHRDGDTHFTKKSLIYNEYIGGRWTGFARDFQKAVYLDGKLFIHRCVTVKDPPSFEEDLSRGALPKGYKGLGIFWSWDYGAAKCHWGHHNEGGIPVVMTGLVDPKAIDIEGTVLANFHPDVGEEEMEIRLKEGAVVLLTDLSSDETWPLRQYDPPVKLRA